MFGSSVLSRHFTSCDSSETFWSSFCYTSVCCSTASVSCICLCYESEQNSLNTMHLSIFYDVFQTLVSAIIRWKLQ